MNRDRVNQRMIRQEILPLFLSILQETSGIAKEDIEDKDHLIKLNKVKKLL